MTTTAPEPTAPSLLDATTQIDPAWMEQALAGRHPGGRLAAVDTRPIGAGNVSDTVLVTLSWADRPDGAPDAVVAKFRPVDPAVHAHGLASGAYHREIGAYRAITERAACRIPLLYSVTGDETNINLVVEDLTGATPGNQAAGCGVEQARAVLTQQARLHAAFFPIDPATAPAWPIRLPDVADYWSDKMRAGVTIAEASYADRLTPDELAVVAAGAEVVHDWHLLHQDRLSLTHGDPRVDNILFEQTTDGPGAVLIDWQVTGIRNPMYDVGYFLSGSVDADVRRPVEQELLAHYVAEFDAVTPGVYTPELAAEDLRTQMLSGLVITTAAIAVLPDVEPVRDLITALLRRNVAAVQDWDSIAATRARAAR